MNQKPQKYEAVHLGLLQPAAALRQRSLLRPGPWEEFKFNNMLARQQAVRAKAAAGCTQSRDFV